MKSTIDRTAFVTCRLFALNFNKPYSVFTNWFSGYLFHTDNHLAVFFTELKFYFVNSVEYYPGLAASIITGEVV